MTASKRQLKYARLIQRELAVIFQQDLKHWFSGDMITVTEVQVTPDLKIASVFVSFLLSESATEPIKKIIDRKGEIKKVLGNRIGKSVRSIPELRFFHDQSIEKAQQIDKLLEELDLPNKESDLD